MRTEGGAQERGRPGTDKGISEVGENSLDREMGSQGKIYLKPLELYKNDG